MIDELYQKYNEKILLNCRYLVRNKPIEAEDLSQEVWIKICKYPHLDKIDNFLAWARKLSIRTMIDLQRKDENRPYYCSLLWDRPDPYEPRTLGKAEELIASLSEKDQDLVRKVYLEGYDMKEIAKKERTTPEALWKRMSRIRAKLKEKYNG